MNRYLASALAAAALVLAWALPAEARKKPPADPDAQACELEWTASFGNFALKQEITGAGALQREDLQIDRDFPNSGSWGRLGYTEHVYLPYSPGSPSFHIGLNGPMKGSKHQRLVVAMPDGEPIVLAMEYSAVMIPVSAAELERMIAAGKPLNYRMIKVNGKGEETALLGEGWFDLSGFAGKPLAGLPDAARLSRDVLAQARKSDNPPCVMIWAAEMNSADYDEPVRKWLSFECVESWEGPLGKFELREKSYRWTPRPRGGVELELYSEFRPAPRPEMQAFVNSPGEYRYGKISARFDKALWSENFRVAEPPLRERQYGEFRRGQFVARNLIREGSVEFYGSQISEVMKGEGDLEIAAVDKISGASTRVVMPWAELLQADEELRQGQRRRIEREADPMARCKAKVDVEYGGEELIVT